MKHSALPFYHILSKEGRNRLEQNLTPFSFEKGQIVHAAGDGSYGMLYVESGTLSVSLMHNDQRRITLLRLSKGDVCFLNALESIPELRFEVNVETETDASIRSLSDDVLTELMHREPKFELYVYRTLAKNYNETVKILYSAIFETVERRLAVFLLTEAKAADTNTVSATHEQIAFHIGTSREVVTRILKAYSDRGILSLSRGQVSILDMQKLKRYTK